MEMFEVGGCVRDGILGIKSKDIDFSVVLDQSEDVGRIGNDPFEVMVFKLKKLGFKIFLESPEFLTVRAQFPNGHASAYVNPVLAGGTPKTRKGLTADFVLARKESDYTDGRRPDRVEIGTLHDDLARRDFTMNAIAKDSAGNLIDPFGGQKDIERKMIRCVGNPMERFDEDALRMLRAVRFKVTKGFSLHHEIMQALHNGRLLDKLSMVSDERVMDELNKMLKFNTIRSLEVLEMFPGLRSVIFSGRVSLDATMKQKGRGR